MTSNFTEWYDGEYNLEPRESDFYPVHGQQEPHSPSKHLQACGIMLSLKGVVFLRDPLYCW